MIPWCDPTVPLERQGGAAPSAATQDAPPDTVCLAWPDVGAFTIRGAESVHVRPAPCVPPEVLRLYLTGPVAAVLLHYKGFLVLHGSAVALQGAATAFLAASGWGKSTLAAALHRRGHLLIADDVAAIDMDGSPTVLPSSAHLKLWPDALASLGDDAEALPRVHPQLEKRLQAIENPSPAEPIPLERVYVIADAPALAVEPLDSPAMRRTSPERRAVLRQRLSISRPS